MRKGQVIGVCIITMGCAKNEVDSADMASRLLAAGYRMLDAPEEADAIIVNTCSFIQAATEESIEAIFEAAGLPRVRAGRTELVVAGCMPARYGEDLADSLEEVKTFVPCGKEDDIVAVLDGLFPGRVRAQGEPGMVSQGPSAYVKISDGCDRFCSYCTIPFIRGRYHSFSFEQIEADVARAVESGAREIVLIAQDSGRWGQDLEEGRALAWLLGALAQRHPRTWLRVMYLQPEGVTDRLLECLRSHDNVCSYLDIPFQHCNERILRSMNRKGTRESYLRLVEHVREAVPGITLRTTLIAGFPGETEADFEELCDFIEDIDFDYVGVFPYSREEGTRAAGLPDQIDQDSKEERAQQVRELADSLSQARIANRIGQDMDILVLGEEADGQLFGRAQCQAPDVDGLTYLDRGGIGAVQRVRIGATLFYEMEGEAL